ncbi:hypothetical protein V8F33_006909 [Rhypophila sp. PSN 637]
MGANLSNLVEEDKSGIALAGPDRQADIILGIIWALCIYGVAMIWCAVSLIGRWAGPHGERGVNMFSVLAAFILSAGWPVVLVYLVMNPA